MSWLRNNIGPFLAFLLVAIALAIPAIIRSPMLHGSFWIDYVWAKQFSELLWAGELYPRWLPESFNGSGAPVFYFYAPISFYVAAVFSFLGTWQSIIAAFIAFHALSGATMYAWLDKFGRRRAMFGAILYMAMPYHFMDFLRRGALAEFAAFAIIPLVAIGVERAGDTRRFGLLAIAYAALVMTHLPVALLTSVFLIPVLSWRREWMPIGLGLGIGIGIAAIYLLPALSLQEHINSAALWRANFTPDDWILFNAWQWLDRRETLLFAAAIVLSAFAGVVLWGGGFWPRYTVALCFIAGGLIPFLWSIPLLAKVQFPWRTLTLVEFALVTAIVRSSISPRVLFLILAGPIGLLLLAAVAPLPVGISLAEVERTMPDVLEYQSTNFPANPVEARIGLVISAITLGLLILLSSLKIMGRSNRAFEAQPE